MLFLTEDPKQKTKKKASKASIPGILFENELTCEVPWSNDAKIKKVKEINFCIWVARLIVLLFKTTHVFGRFHWQRWKADLYMCLGSLKQQKNIYLSPSEPFFQFLNVFLDFRNIKCTYEAVWIYSNRKLKLKRSKYS